MAFKTHLENHNRLRILDVDVHERQTKQQSSKMNRIKIKKSINKKSRKQEINKIMIITKVKPISTHHSKLSR